MHAGRGLYAGLTSGTPEEKARARAEAAASTFRALGGWLTGAPSPTSDPGPPCAAALADDGDDVTDSSEDTDPSLSEAPELAGGGFGGI